MPAFAFAEMGEQKTLRLLSDVGLAERFIDERHGYIPEHALCEFVTGISRALGEDRLGLLFASYLTVEDYGAWGQYVLSAPDLRTALLRAQQEMRLHSNIDRVSFECCEDFVSYSYNFGHKSHASYPNLAYSAAGAMLSIPKHFLGQSWTPSKVEFDFPAAMGSSRAEETFGCPILYNRSRLRLVFPLSAISTPRSGLLQAKMVTREDILRERAAPPSTFLQSIRAVLDMQIADRNVSLERLALAMGTGPRSIQRLLSINGMNFRALLTTARMERACEMMVLKGITVASVADTLGYEEPGNFSRAFKQHFGVSPTKYIQASPKI